MTKELEAILSFAVRNGVSDIHLKAGRPPTFRHNGALVAQKSGQRLTDEMIGAMVGLILREDQRVELDRSGEVDTAFSASGIGRFRVNVFHQRARTALVLRVIKPDVPHIADLMLPSALERLAEERRGLVLVTGATGSGKSTTMAAMVQHINESRPAHIVTIEDPIEFHFDDCRSVVDQREIGVDTTTFARALRAALRQDPDVILVGEMRDLETIETAMHAAETGHLVISTLHTVDAVETVNRIVTMFPNEQQRLARLQLAGVLRGVVSQRLVPRKDSQGRVPACEVLIATELTREVLLDPERLPELRDFIARGRTAYGMQTFDQSLMELYRADQISYEVALEQCTNPSDFALRVSGISGTSDSSWGT